MNDETKSSGQRLLASGTVLLDGVGCAVLRRNMVVLDRNGEMVGMVAAVLWNDRSHSAIHFLLGTIPPAEPYRLVPLSGIGRIDQASIWLQIAAEEIAGLPPYHAGS